MLVPLLQKSALTSYALATSLSLNSIVAPLPTSVEGNIIIQQHQSLASTSWVSVSAAAATAATQPPVAAAIPFHQYDTANDIPASFFNNKETIRGRVVKVVDGDTIRVRHTPLYPSSTGENACVGKKLTECTISVRLYAVDAPETAKSGNPGQPYSQEAKDYITDKAYDKVVQVKLLRKDRYSRVVGSVTVLSTDLSVGLVENGYASIYTGGGAEYDGKRDELEKAVQKAQSKKVGIWSNGVDDFQDPAAYKREMRAKKKFTFEDGSSS